MANGVQVLRKWFNRRIRDAEASKINRVLRELEFFRIEHDASLASGFEKFNRTPPMSSKVVVVMQSVVDTALVALKIRHNVVETPVVTVST